MNQQWVLRFPATYFRSLSSLRLTQNLHVSEVEQEIWLRGSHLEKDLSRKLRAIPDSELFHVDANRQLIPTGRQVPHGYLPETDWQPIQEWYTVQLEPAALAGTTEPLVPFEVVRSQHSQPANLLLTTLAHLIKLIEHSAQIRLNSLRYAVDSQQRAIVCGAPLPSLKGTFFSEQKGIAVETGWTWRPAVDADVLQSLFQLNQGDIVLLHSDQSRELIRASQFTPLTRSSVRLTLQSFETKGAD